jgi:hypothetical protein
VLDDFGQLGPRASQSPERAFFPQVPHRPDCRSDGRDVGDESSLKERVQVERVRDLVDGHASMKTWPAVTQTSRFGGLMSSC